MRVTADVTIHWDQDSFAREFWDVAWNISQRAARDIPGLETADVFQGLWEWVFEQKNWNEVQTFAKGLAITALKRQARKMARKMREQEMEDRGQYLYRTPEIRALLERAMWDDISETPDVDGYIDIQRAFAILSEAQKRAVFKRYGLGMHLTAGSSDQSNESAAVQRITQYLNIGGGPNIEIPLDNADHYVEHRKHGTASKATPDQLNEWRESQ